MYHDRISGKTYDRFNSVDAVATQIFEKMPDLRGTSTSAQEPPTPPDCKAAQGLTDPGVLLALTERVVTSLLVAIEGRGGSNVNIVDLCTATTKANRVDGITYHAAQKRSQLPDGIEPLQGARADRSEEAMMASIRDMMTEQEREFEERAREEQRERIARKRALSREVLQPLAPATEVEMGVPVVPEPPKGSFFARRVAPALCPMLRSTYFLAIGLSGWSTLCMMVLIEPEVATGLFLHSLLLLVAAYCMFSEHTA